MLAFSAADGRMPCTLHCVCCGLLPAGDSMSERHVSLQQCMCKPVWCSAMQAGLWHQCLQQRLPSRQVWHSLPFSFPFPLTMSRFISCMQLTCSDFARLRLMSRPQTPHGSSLNSRFGTTTQLHDVYGPARTLSRHPVSERRSRISRQAWRQSTPGASRGWETQSFGMYSMPPMATAASASATQVRPDVVHTLARVRKVC